MLFKAKISHKKNIIKRIFMSCKIAEHLGVFIMKKQVLNIVLNHYFKKSYKTIAKIWCEKAIKKTMYFHWKKTDFLV